MRGFAQQTGGCGNGKDPQPAACAIESGNRASVTDQAKDAAQKEAKKKK